MGRTISGDGSALRPHGLVALVTLAVILLAMSLGAAGTARAHGYEYAFASAPYINDGHVWAKGKSYTSDHHRKHCVTVWLQEWDDGQWQSAHGWYDCKYDHSGYVYSDDTTNCGWSWTTITERYRTKAKSEVYNRYGELVHHDVDYSEDRTLSC